MESITVRIQGESDWIQPELKVEDLNKLKDPNLKLPPISATIGKLLDIGSATLSTENKQKVESLLSQYVANLKIYELMLTEEMHSLFITSFRAKGPFAGYVTRVAGTIRDHINDSITVTINDPTFPALPDTGYVILLKLIASNPNYKKDKYHSKSLFHLINKQAYKLSGKIEIKSNPSPQNN